MNAHANGRRAASLAAREPDEGGISVALCTFNGARYLRQQLRSILGQSRRPDQIVICDDGSSDDSVEIARQTLRDTGIAHHVLVNATQLGPSANYEQAVRCCGHGIIAFCDQDDLWRPDKLSQLEAALLCAPTASAVFSDARAIGELGTPLGFSQWQACWFGPAVREAHRADLFPLLVRYPVVCGATLAIRRRAALSYLPIGAGWLHDEWLALMCAATSRLSFLEAELIDYRVHDAQSVGLAGPSLRQRIQHGRRLDEAYFRAQIRRFTLLAERLEGWSPALPSAIHHTLKRKLAFLRRRAQIRSGRANPWLAATSQLLDGSHHRYGHGVQSWLLDMGYDLLYRRLLGQRP